MTVAEVVRPDLDFALSPLPDLYDVLDEFRALGPAVPVLFATRPLWMIVGYDPVKAAMTLQGRVGPELRLPMTEMSEELIPELKRIMTELGLL